MGDIAIFGMDLLHSTVPNVSGTFRLSCDTRWQPKSDPPGDVNVGPWRSAPAETTEADGEESEDDENEEGEGEEEEEEEKKDEGDSEDNGDEDENERKKV